MRKPRVVKISWENKAAENSAYICDGYVLVEKARMKPYDKLEVKEPGFLASDETLAQVLNGAKKDANTPVLEILTPVQAGGKNYVLFTDKWRFEVAKKYMDFLKRNVKWTAIRICADNKVVAFFQGEDVVAVVVPVPGTVEEYGEPLDEIKKAAAEREAQAKAEAKIARAKRARTITANWKDKAYAEDSPYLTDGCVLAVKKYLREHDEIDIQRDRDYVSEEKIGKFLVKIKARATARIVAILQPNKDAGEEYYRVRTRDYQYLIAPGYWKWIEKNVQYDAVKASMETEYGPIVFFKDGEVAAAVMGRSGSGPREDTPDAMLRKCKADEEKNEKQEPSEPKQSVNEIEAEALRKLAETQARLAMSLQR